MHRRPECVFFMRGGPLQIFVRTMQCWRFSNTMKISTRCSSQHTFHPVRMNPTGRCNKGQSCSFFHPDGRKEQLWDNERRVDCREPNYGRIPCYTSRIDHSCPIWSPHKLHVCLPNLLRKFSQTLHGSWSNLQIAESKTGDHHLGRSHVRQGIRFRLVVGAQQNHTTAGGEMKGVTTGEVRWTTFHRHGIKRWMGKG